ncbi:hypothetical protein RLN34_07440 [Streptococcus pneumoniae]|mgnify:FL=1|jgi:hypothetical protein|uniref:ABC-three component system middle component 1 n=1 Tax=Streptococcus pneumoniae TaxID=1313 RepID=UPI000765340C|nr:ABC-three component system middle component 1 [Streptococcus pneumoniae]MDS6110031.1 hypothetical protein [Streptococcus pneumoniae]MDS9465337.1 hypothetical protein [Streptococcus pneumoniae]CVT09174.1 Uncharacterised protein [Streptococcus pneumoniae]CWA53888.1 Uncharacterised protein [Streptococcus pneumoniae]VKD10326.1 Uncharacterised protein [Streptococcus pneumoniae]
MNDFLASIMDSSGYNLIEGISLELFGNEHEFFLIEHFEIGEIQDFFKTEKLENLISQFQKVDNKIQKNTSLFILIKVDNIHEFYNLYLNKIVSIEEDEYYFRKYVIFYTEEGLVELKPDADSLLQYIQENDDDSDEESLFDKFEKNMFFDDSYFIAMQLIIKLPFISLPHSNDHFETIEDRIESRIKTEELLQQEKQVTQILELFNSDKIGSQLEDATIIYSLQQILEDGACENQEDFTL